MPENLPKSLKTLSVGCNAITMLPKNLPDSLEILNCSCNTKFQALPIKLPNTLKELNCCQNFYLVLPKYLPESLKKLNISLVRHINLVKLPDSLEELRCNSCYDNINNLLNILPDTLKVLHCNKNRLKTLPENLPNSLIELDCSGNDFNFITKQHLKYILKVNL